MERVEYRVIRSDRKTLGLEIGKGTEVLVRAPRRISEEQIEIFVRRHRAWIEKKLAQRRAFLAAHPEPSEAELAGWMERAKAIIPARAAYYAEIMGVTHTGIRYTRNRTRVGSCCRQNRLSFSCRLMGYPQEVLDYVVVHELAHITHKNHGADFWRAVETVLPDYQVRRAMLRG
ncbi:MAG: M48 family metallopeptidase [Oscillospiraceae bacterium]|nr:M48 family metallopeptidase [Oscillospiraceae bacterium]